jgi:hypothetical protein
MLTSLNQISPASGNPLSESRLQGLGIRLGYRRLDFITGSHPTFAKLRDEEPA